MEPSMRQIAHKVIAVFFLLASAGWAQTVYNPGNGAGPQGAPISIGAVDAIAPQLDCEAFTGASPDVQCQNAILAFSGVGVTIDARGFSNPIFVGNPFPYMGTNGHYNATAVSGKLLLPGGTVKPDVPIVIPNRWRVYGLCGIGGAGQACTVVQPVSGTFPGGCGASGLRSTNSGR